MRNRFLLLLLIVSCCHTTAWCQYESAFALPYPQRFLLIDSIFFTQPQNLRRDSVFVERTLHALQTAAEKEGDRKALLLVEAYRYRSFFTRPWMTEQWSATIATDIIRRAKSLNFPELEAVMTTTLGHYYSGHPQEGLGLYYQLKGFDLLSQLPVSSLPATRIAYNVYTLADKFYEFGDNAKAIHYAREVEHYPQNDMVRLFNADLLGMAHMKLGAYDSALLYFDRGLVLARTLNSQGSYFGWKGILEGNKAHVYFRKGEYDKAIPLYRMAIDSTAAYGLWDNTTGFAVNLAMIYLMRHDMPAATALLQTARKGTYAQETVESRLDLYRLLAAYERACGHYKEALMYMDSSALWTELLNKRLGRNVQVQAELAVETESRRAEEKLLQLKLEAQQRYSGLIAVLAVLALALGVLIYNRKRLQFKLHREKAAMALSGAESRLHEFTAMLLQKNELIERLEQQVGSSLNEDDLQKLHNNTILTEDDWNNFKNLFDKVHAGYLLRLKDKLPSLTPAEIRFMALAKLNFSNKEMAATLGISPASVRSTRSRLLKKLELPEDSSLEAWVQQL